MTRIFLSAGESSGDVHGANLVRALRAAEPGVVCEGVGGRHMAAAGMVLRHDLAGQALMGFTEVAKAFRAILRVFHDTVEALAAQPPDALVLIDYPGFNLRLAARARRLGIPVVYYVSPQVWAWKRRRIHTIARRVNKMLVILPFEEALYRAIGVDCTYVGHPLLDHVASARPEGLYRGGRVIGLLPGSRRQEIERLLPLMLEVAAGLRAVYPDARFVAPCVDEARESQVRELSGGFPLETVVGKAYEVLDGARFCLVTSGTATLETALFGVPMVIVYRMGRVNYWVARSVVRLEHIGLVNILAGRGIVPEFIQHGATADRILPVALDLIADSPARTAMIRALAEVKAQLGAPGASARAAAEVLAATRGGRGAETGSSVHA